MTELGHDLKRPECVVAHSSGLTFVSDWSETGGVCVLNSAGKCAKLLVSGAAQPLRPNGIALDKGGCFLLAHLGDKNGGIYQMRPDGTVRALVTHANGQPLPPTNFVCRDADDRIWITVSTTIQPRAHDYRADANSGFIAVAYPGESNARIVADGLGYTNECSIDLENGAVYVNETFGKRLSAFDLADDGSLSNQRVIAEFDSNTYPDGLTRDEEGFFWITSIISNRILRVAPSGEQTIIFEDSDEEQLTEAADAFAQNELQAAHL